MRTEAAAILYQASLSLIYVKAVSDVLGVEANVSIRNSLNKGFYTKINTSRELTAELISDIETRMREIVEADLPFRKEVLSRESAIRMVDLKELD